VRCYFERSGLEGWRCEEVRRAVEIKGDERKGEERGGEMRRCKKWRKKVMRGDERCCVVR
jgi:hypothetical protein